MIWGGSCFLWIPIFYEQVVKIFVPKRQCEYLPENVIAEILCRLPENSVHQCRAVCKQWNSLISTMSFNQMYLARAPPTLILFRRSMQYEELVVLKWGDLNKNKPTTESIYKREILPDMLHVQDTIVTHSDNGFLSLCPIYGDGQNITIIYNQFTREKLIVHTRCYGFMCGVYFHQSSREYRLLWLTVGNLRLICLGSHKKPYWRRLCNIPYKPMVRGSPVHLNGALHWMTCRFFNNHGEILHTNCSNSVTIFNTETEDLHVMPHPEDISGCGSTFLSHHRLHLFSLHDKLALCRLDTALEIWILEDYAKWAWTKTYHFKPDLKFLRGHIPLTTLLGIQNGALIFHFRSEALFAYHLQKRTANKVLFSGDPADWITPRLLTRSLFRWREYQPVDIIYMDS